jgi:hypothetical protein
MVANIYGLGGSAAAAIAQANRALRLSPFESFETGVECYNRA